MRRLAERLNEAMPESELIEIATRMVELDGREAGKMNPFEVVQAAKRLVRRMK
jgi:hypothetical protein